METIITWLASPSNVWFGVLFAVLAGLLTSIAPCALSGLPIFGDYVASRRRGQGTLLLALVFCAGMLVVLVAMSFGVSLIGSYLMRFDVVIHIVLAVAMAVFGLHYLGLIHLHHHSSCGCDCAEQVVADPCECECHETLRPGLVGALWRGAVWGAVDLPCTIPVLIVLTALSASWGWMVGALLLLAFAIGHCLVVIVVGIGIASLNRVQTGSRRLMQILGRVIGVLLLALSVYLIIAIFLE